MSSTRKVRPKPFVTGYPDWMERRRKTFSSKQPCVNLGSKYTTNTDENTMVSSLLINLDVDVPTFRI